MRAFVGIYLIYLSSSLASFLWRRRTLCCRQDTRYFRSFCTKYARRSKCL